MPFIPSPPPLKFIRFASCLAVEKIPCEKKEEKDIPKLVSGIVKCSINRRISYKTVGPNEVRAHVLARSSGSPIEALNGVKQEEG